MTAIDVEVLKPFPAVVNNLYRDIHKGIRAELFDITGTAGRIDPADAQARDTFVARVTEVFTLLENHAEHEDAVLDPVLEPNLPHIAETITNAHACIEAHIVALSELLDEAVAATGTTRAQQLNRVYLELAAFTGQYLQHQDYEERVVMPTIEQELGVDTGIALHHAIVARIPPAEMAAGLAVMLPAMNIDDRVEVLGAMRENAPREVFTGVWGLASSVLTTADFAALGGRLGLV
jgi:hemerythrin-like domain-containing protein